MNQDRTRDFIYICNPENRRAEFFRSACSHLGFPKPTEIAWDDLLTRQDELLAACEWNADTVVRVESPGENFEVERFLIEKGGGPKGIEHDHGRLRYQVEWFVGWRKTLEEIDRFFDGAAFMNPPSDIALMFDKWSAQRHLEKNDVPIPALVGGQIQSFDDLIERLRANNCSRAFLKPAHSSSASGVVALQLGKRDRMIATTSAELIVDQNRIYNSLRLRHYTDPSDVRLLVDLLARENLMAERWFPKASVQGKAFDLRVLVIAGQARHVVARTSASPITNLHLGNERGSIPEIRKNLGEEVWGEAMLICEQAALSFPNSHYVAVDLMVSSSRNRFAVAEVNAFGDLIPNIYSDDDDTYTAELRSFVD